MIIPPIITIIKIFFISNKMLHILFYKRLLARNVSLFTFSGKRHDLFTLTILPVQLKALSEGTDVEGMQRYFRAKLATVHREIFTLLNFCEFCKLRLSRKNFSRKNLCRQLVGAVIVGGGILLSLRTSSYGCKCVWCLSDGSFKVF